MRSDLETHPWQWLALGSVALPLAACARFVTWANRRQTALFRDALFVGSTYGEEGLTTGVWVGFDDNRSLGRAETGARNALPVFAEIMRQVYERQRLAVAPAMPAAIEQSIDSYLSSRARALPTVPLPAAAAVAPVLLGMPAAAPAEGEEK